jgi:hypothetical protein
MKNTVGCVIVVLLTIFCIAVCANSPLGVMGM